MATTSADPLRPNGDRGHRHDDPTGPMEVHAATKHVRTARQSSGNNFGDAERRFVLSARHFDLVLVGSRTRPNGLPPDLIERILLGCGRPVLIGPPQPPSLVLGTVMVCWKEAAEGARAIAAAMPLQVNAKQVLLAGAKERDPSLGDGLGDLSSQAVWHEISAKIDFHAVGCGSGGRSVDGGCPGRITPTCWLWVPMVTAYAQIVFGGFTQSVLESAKTPVFLTH